MLIPRRCLWISVVKDTMMSLSGQRPHLYSHNLISLMKFAGQETQAMLPGSQFTGRLTNRLLPKRFQPTVKVPDTRGCHIASVIRNPFNGSKYLCTAVEKTIIVMEWYNPRSTFMEVKRVS
ncbi:unnamed protein product [Protopolystoma xenopodis]|uniref:CNH domain-containing protein n=1 Tax=Protopolystoma xenopodis TaxID=117903 RepID=A0A448X218_9PLAT|nr:unnamed protein product [Protopolystoma xenopodis]